MDLNRRTLLKRVGQAIGGLLALPVLARKANAEREPQIDNTLHTAPPDKESISHCFCCECWGILFVTRVPFGREIVWTRWHSSVQGIITISTADVCTALRVIDGQVYWYGKREIWTIQEVAGRSELFASLVSRPDSQCYSCYCGGLVFWTCSPTGRTGSWGYKFGSFGGSFSIPTDDVCVGLKPVDGIDVVHWLGKREVWRLEKTGIGTFRSVCVS